MKKWIKRTALFLLLVFVITGIGLGYVLFLLTHRVQGEYFDSNGVKIHYTVEGEGKETVVLIHGLAAQADINWRVAGITDMLAKHFKVVMFDLRGHGLSDKPETPEQYGIQMELDVLRLMDHLKIEKAHIAGYSLGGFIALKFVTDHPDRVLSAAYCASGWKDPADPADIRSPYRAPDEPDTYKDNKENKKEASRLSEVQAASVLDFGLFKAPVDYVKGYLGDSVLPRPVRKALKSSYLDLIVTKEDLKKDHIPSICFIGTQDGLKPYADALKENMPALELVVLEGANHITTAINSEFHEKLLAFFEAHE